MTAQPDLNNNTRIDRDDFGDVAAEIFACAFVDDPFVKECLKLEDDQLAGFFDPLVSLAHLSAPSADSYVLYDGDAPAAAATLLPPDWKPEEYVIEHALLELRQKLGFLAMTRVYRMLKGTNRLPVPEERSTHLLFLGTHPEHRRRGHGLTMLRFLDERSCDLGARSIYLEVEGTSPARCLYEAHGYAEIGRAKILGHDIAVLWRRLG